LKFIAHPHKKKTTKKLERFSGRGFPRACGPHDSWQAMGANVLARTRGGAKGRRGVEQHQPTNQGGQKVCATAPGGSTVIRREETEGGGGDVGLEEKGKNSKGKKKCSAVEELDRGLSRTTDKTKDQNGNTNETTCLETPRKPFAARSPPQTAKNAKKVGCWEISFLPEKREVNWLDFTGKLRGPKPHRKKFLTRWGREKGTKSLWGRGLFGTNNENTGKKSTKSRSGF